MNIPLCGMLPMYLPEMCFDSLSGIMVKYVSASYGNCQLYNDCVTYISFLKNKIETSTS